MVGVDVAVTDTFCPNVRPVLVVNGVVVDVPKLNPGAILVVGAVNADVVAVAGVSAEVVVPKDALGVVAAGTANNVPPVDTVEGPNFNPVLVNAGVEVENGKLGVCVVVTCVVG